MAAQLRKLNPPVLAGFGNPLLDICVNLKDNSFYSKYNLDSDGQKEIDSSELISIINYFKEEKCDFKYCVGGSAQNSLRVFQWLIKEPYYSVFFGGIGEDEQGKLLEEEVYKSGVCTRYVKHQTLCTGTCIAIINGIERSLVAHLGAANVYSISDFTQSENLNIFKTLFIVYIEGFFISHSFETALEVIKLCKINGIAVAFNLSGVYLFQKHYKEILQLLESSDFVIGNVNEFKEFWKYHSGELSSVIEILTYMQSSISSNEDDSTRRKSLKLPIFAKENKIIVCTQSSESVLCIYGNKDYLEVKPNIIEKSLIKDTTGAGDAFVAGFLAGMLQNKDLKESVELGCWAAEQIIQQIGCSLP